MREEESGEMGEELRGVEEERFGEYRRQGDRGDRRRKRLCGKVEEGIGGGRGRGRGCGGR